MPDDDGPLKSSYEVALERLRARDRAAGIDEPKPLTQSQKEKIARLRQEARAKIAELEIMHRDELAAAQGDPGKIAEIEEHFAVDRGRVESTLESAIARIKKG